MPKLAANTPQKTLKKTDSQQLATRRQNTLHYQTIYPLKNILQILHQNKPIYAIQYTIHKKTQQYNTLRYKSANKHCNTKHITQKFTTTPSNNSIHPTTPNYFLVDLKKLNRKRQFATIRCIFL